MNKKMSLRVIALLTILTGSVGFPYGISANKALAKGIVKPAAIVAVNLKTANASSQEKAVTPEKNPPGDIPDTQVFIKYTSKSGGYSIQVPEGWSRTVKGNNVSFFDKYNGIKVQLSSTTQTFNIDSIKMNQVENIKQTGRAVNIKKINEVRLSAEKAIKVTYDSNSEPNSVTNKQIRLENESYFFYKHGKLITLTLYAPLGADNVDQWKLISGSLRW